MHGLASVFVAWTQATVTKPADWGDYATQIHFLTGAQARSPRPRCPRPSVCACVPLSSAKDAPQNG